MRLTLRPVAAAALLLCLHFGQQPANAATVKIYGAIDNGLTYEHIDGAGSSLQMTAGNYAGSRVGLFGEEDLGDGISVGFVLEEGFSADTGAFAQADSMFSRESQIHATGPWGTIGFGRVGGFSTGSTSLSWYWDMDPFDTGYIDAGNQATQLNVWRVNNNTAYYITPNWKGWKLGLQYSLTGTKTQEQNAFSDNDGWVNAAVRFDGANAKWLLGLEWERFGQVPSADARRQDNAWNIKSAFVWTPQASRLTLYLSGSWFRNQRSISDSAASDNASIGFRPDSGRGLGGVSAAIGAKYSRGADDWIAQVQYLDGENKAAAEGTNPEYSRFAAAAGLHHHFSKRTFGYVIGSYADGSGFIDDFDSAASNRAQCHIGIFHRF